MSNNNTFITSYSKELKSAFQKKKSNMEGKYKLNEEQSEVAVFRKRDKAAVYQTEVPAGEDYDFDVANTSKVTTTPYALYGLEFIPDWDRFKTDLTLQEDAKKNVINAVWREFDRRCYAALALASTTVTLPTPNKLDNAGMQKLQAALNIKEVDPENRYALISQGGADDLSADSLIMNNLQFNQTVIQDGGVAPKLAGFTNILEPTYLPIPSAGQRTNIFWQKDALGVAINRPFEVKVWEDQLKGGWFVMCAMSMNAIIIEDAGVVLAAIAD